MINANSALNQSVYIRLNQKILMPEEKDKTVDKEINRKEVKKVVAGPAFHEKSEKNLKVNLGGSYKREIKKKYKKPKTRPPKTKGKK